MRKRTAYVKITLSPALHEQIVKAGFSEEYGGRHLKKTVERMVTDPISDAVIKEEIPEEGAIYLDWKEEKVIVSKVKEDAVIEPPEPVQVAGSVLAV